MSRRSAVDTICRSRCSNRHSCPQSLHASPAKSQKAKGSRASERESCNRTCQSSCAASFQYFQVNSSATPYTHPQGDLFKHPFQRALAICLSPLCRTAPCGFFHSNEVIAVRHLEHIRGSHDNRTNFVAQVHQIEKTICFLADMADAVKIQRRNQNRKKFVLGYSAVYLHRHFAGSS